MPPPTDPIKPYIIGHHVKLEGYLLGVVESSQSGRQAGEPGPDPSQEKRAWVCPAVPAASHDVPLALNEPNPVAEGTR